MISLSTKISTPEPKTMIYTTLKRIRKHSPCSEGWKRLIRRLGTDFPMGKPFPMVEILNAEGDGLDDCLWALRAEPQHAKLYRLYAVRRARSVQHLMKDPRSIAAIDVAERYAHGTATEDERDAARAAAWAAARDAASDAARAAASTDLREMLTNHHAMPGEPAL